MTAARPRGPVRPPHLAREIVLTVAAVLGSCCVLATVAGFVFGLQPLIFRSGSMAPAIPTGSLALARSVPADSLSVGEIVCVVDAAGTRITHRVVHTRHQADGTTLLTLQGDANPVQDVEVYPVRSADRVMVSVPELGYLVSGLSAPPVVFCAGALVGALAVVVRPRPGRVTYPRRQDAVS